jgi:hypothetical protein
MNTLISIVMAIVLNFLGVEVQERKLAANAQTEIIAENSYTECAKLSTCISHKASAGKREKKKQLLHHQSESNINVN